MKNRVLSQAGFEYSLWNYHVVSDLELGELEPGCGRDGLLGQLRLSRVSGADWPKTVCAQPIEYRNDNGDEWASFSKSGEDEYFAHFPRMCTFRIQPELLRIEYAPEPGIAQSTIAHLLLDHAIPRLLSLRGNGLVLHAGAFVVEGQAVAVLGTSGRGKSTLSAWFASHGLPALTDDCLVLQWNGAVKQWLAQPSYQSVRLWPDSVQALGIEDDALREFAGYSSKKRTGRNADVCFASKEAPLTAFFVLTEEENSAEPVIQPLSTSESFMALAESVFRLETESRSANQQEFHHLTGLMESVPFYSLSYARTYDLLPKVQKAVLETVLKKQINEETQAMPTNPTSPASAKFVIPKSVMSRTIGKETILLNLETSTYHSLNQVGGKFWALINDGKDFEQAAAVLREQYKNVNAAQLEADLRELCAELKRLCLLQTA